MESYLGSKCGCTGSIQNRKEAPTAFSRGLSYTTCPCSTVQSYRLEQLWKTSVTYPWACKCCTYMSSRGGPSSVCQRQRLFLGVNLQRWAAGDIPTAGAPGDAARSPAHQQQLAEGSFPPLLPALLPLSHGSRPNHSFCLSLPSKRFPRFLVSPLLESSGWKRCIHTPTCRLTSAPPACSITHTHCPSLS